MVEYEEERPELGRPVIGIRTALILYAVLVAIALGTLTGYALAVALIIILALAAKTCVHHFRERLE